jgi:NADP-dependent 3-hydroxy acid dehydrogenase YdfG
MPTAGPNRVENLKRKIAWVTGAGTGIGEAARWRWRARA